MKISIAGNYITKFGELWGKSLRDLLFEAMDGAIADANFDPKDVEAIFVANMAAGSFSDQRHLGALASSRFDHFPPAMRIEGACASGGLALIAAQYALYTKKYKTVLVVGVEKMTDADVAETTQYLATAADGELEFGSTFPGLYAILANAHMKKFGTSRNALSAVAVKNHRHGMLNSKAQFHKELTLEQVNVSSLVASPLRILDCSPISDGAAAVILTSNLLTKKPKLLGFGQGQDSLDLANRSSLFAFPATVKAARQAYATTNLLPKNIQAAEVHDCFTIAELFAIEDLGFVEKGSAGLATLENRTTFGGDVVINPSGGLKACGHPVGATGVKQVAYLANQIEIGNFTTVLAHNVGGSGATATVHILGK